jgi:hypothetical protein
MVWIDEAKTGGGCRRSFLPHTSNFSFNKSTLIMNCLERLLQRLEHHSDQHPGYYFLLIVVGGSLLVWGAGWLLMSP